MVPQAAALRKPVLFLQPPFVSYSSSGREEAIMNAPKDRAMLVQAAASANKIRGRAVPRAGGCDVAAAHPILPARIHHDPERRRSSHPFDRIVVLKW